MLFRADLTNPNVTRKSPTLVAIAAMVGLGLVLRLSQLLIPGHLYGLTEYDDGVYFGASIRLMHGIIAYKNFALVQPPGIVVLLSPFAFLSRFVGEEHALAVTRIFTVVVSTVNIALVGRLVKNKGLGVSLVACGFMALYPASIATSQTVLLEPYLNLFCLIGISFLIFEGKIRVELGRILVCGLFIGIAGSIKTWAVLPAIVVLILILVVSKHIVHGAIFVVGLVAGFLVFSLPFIISSPVKFFNDVILDQVFRVPGHRVGFIPRLTDLLAANPWIRNFGHANFFVSVLAFVIALVLVGSVANVLIERDHLELFALFTLVIVFFSLLWPNDFYYHYPTFIAPYLSVSLAFGLKKYAGIFMSFWLLGRQVIIIVLCLSIMLVTANQLAYERTIPDAPRPLSFANKVVPSGLCITSDEASLLIETNLFDSMVNDCPEWVDSFGTALVLSHGRTIDGGASQYPKVVSYWMSVMKRSKFIWLSPQNIRRIPWTKGAESYFQSNFHLVASSKLGLGKIYKRNNSLS